jgi:hypothetical protein
MLDRNTVSTLIFNQNIQLQKLSFITFHLNDIAKGVENEILADR